MHNAMNHPGLEPEMGDIKSHQLVVYDCVRVYIYIYRVGVCGRDIKGHFCSDTSFIFRRKQCTWALQSSRLLTGSCFFRMLPLKHGD